MNILVVFLCYCITHLYVWVLRKTWQKCDRFFVAIFMVECSWCVSCIYTIYMLLSEKSFFHRISISSVSSIEYLLWCASKTSQSSTLVSLQYLKELDWEALFRKLFLKLFNSKDIKINKFLVVLLWLWGGGWFFLKSNLFWCISFICFPVGNEDNQVCDVYCMLWIRNETGSYHRKKNFVGLYYHRRKDFLLFFVA